MSRQIFAKRLLIVIKIFVCRFSNASIQNSKEFQGNVSSTKFITLSFCKIYKAIYIVCDLKRRWPNKGNG